MGDVVAGSITAALAPLAMSFGFILWGEAWRSSAYALNLFKCTLAGSIFCLISFSIRPSLPVSLSDQGMILLSSLLGIVIGDNTWLLALQKIGAKRVIVIDTLKPLFAALLGHWTLGESLSLATCVGIVVSSVGVLLVSLEKDGESTDNASSASPQDGDDEDSEDERENTRPSPSPSPSSSSVGREGSTDHIQSPSPSEEKETERVSGLCWGYLLAAINVALDAVGAVLTKLHGVRLNTWEINYLRFSSAAVSMAFIAGVVYLCKHVIPAYFCTTSSLVSANKERDYLAVNAESVHGESNHRDFSGDNDNTSFSPFEIDQSTHSNGDVKHQFSSADIENKQNDDIVVTDSTGTTEPKEHVWYIFPHYSDMTKEQWAKVTVGVMFVTFLCPALSNYALFQIPLGLCLTLTSLGPVYSIPLVFFMSGERTGAQGWIGALLAVAGVAIMYAY